MGRPVELDPSIWKPPAILQTDSRRRPRVRLFASRSSSRCSRRPRCCAPAPRRIPDSARAAPISPPVRRDDRALAHEGGGRAVQAAHPATGRRRQLRRGGNQPDRDPARPGDRKVPGRSADPSRRPDRARQRHHVGQGGRSAWRRCRGRPDGGLLPPRCTREQHCDVGRRGYVPQHGVGLQRRRRIDARGSTGPTPAPSSGSGSDRRAATCTVPNLTSRKLKVVRKALAQADCKLGKVTRKEGPPPAPARSNARAPRRGKVLADGSK